MLRGKNILLGVSGSIAAYKAAFLTRLLVKAGANVKIILTPAAKDFVTPLTLSTLSKNPVYSDYFDESTGEWNNHVDFGSWADVLLIAPATANTLSKMANGNCDNLLLATYLSAKCPVFYAPAMDLDMYKHQSTLSNLKRLESFGDLLIKPGTGELASGLEGEGRMAEPEEIVEILQNHFDTKGWLKGKKILVNAGPTHEAIDPVRYIGNRSSGKMGYAIAEEAVKLGGDVTLVSGPSVLAVPEGVSFVQVESAASMYEACHQHKNYDIAILAAAVADYRPKNTADQKIKKSDQSLHIDLEPTQDILKSLGESKKGHQRLIGFALETENAIENAAKKIKSKNLDLIVMNTLQDPGAGFSGDKNKVTFIDQHNNAETFELKDKSEVAKDLFNKIKTL